MKVKEYIEMLIYFNGKCIGGKSYDKNRLTA